MSTRRLFQLLFVIALHALTVRHTTDPDMWWHLRMGEQIMAQGIPRQDLFSFTAAHHLWVTREWLAQLVMWQLYQLGGSGRAAALFRRRHDPHFWPALCCDPGPSG
jgi:hypothetical protein